MTLTLRQWLLLALAATLVFAGWHYRSLLDDRQELKGAQVELEHTDEVDQAAAERARVDTAVDHSVGRVLDQNQETARREPSYRDYLDRPLPERSVQLYRDADAALQQALGADGAEQGDHQKDH